MRPLVTSSLGPVVRVTTRVGASSLEAALAADSRYEHYFFFREGELQAHEEYATALALRTLTREGCFVDVGANLGWYCVLASRRAAKGTVVAFEPDAANMALCMKNAAMNRCDSLQLVQMALGSETKICSYMRRDEEPSLELRIGTTQPQIGIRCTVGMTTLDDFCRGIQCRPDVVKIDVEGSEVDVLDGMTHVLAQYRPHVLVECHPRRGREPESTLQVVSRLRRAGYDVFDVGKGVVRGGSMQRLGMRSIWVSNTIVYARPVRAQRRRVDLERGCRSVH